MKTPTTIVNYVHDLLRDKILSGDYPPGTRLNESLIAREHNISRIPVREALVRLRESGLVMKHDRRGMFVIELTPEDIQRINGVRIILEAEALRLCRANMTKKQASKLKDLMEKMENWDGQSEMDAAEIDIEFHRTIWTAAGNPVLYNTLNSLSTALFAHAALQHSTTEAITWQLAHHRTLLDVALGNSTTSPEEAVVNHLKVYYDEPERFCSQAKKK
jgi:DNA-binding GntR family transcriptional regulator